MAIDKYGVAQRIELISDSIDTIKANLKNVILVFKCKKCGTLITKTNVEKVKICPNCKVEIV